MAETTIKKYYDYDDSNEFLDFQPRIKYDSVDDLNNLSSLIIELFSEKNLRKILESQ